MAHNTIEVIPIRHDMPWELFLRELPDHIKDAFPAGIRRRSYYYGHSCLCLDVWIAPRAYYVTVEVYKQDPYTAIVQVGERYQTASCSCRAHGKKMRQLIERLARCYKAWERRDRSICG